MGVSRRTFLILGQTLIGAAAFPTKFWGAIHNPSNKTGNLASLGIANFRPLVNSSFAVGPGASPIAWFRLLSVEPMNAGTKPASATGLRRVHPVSTETFALHFQATGEKLAQGTYDFDHPVLGSFPMFVVPAGPDTFVAIISHMSSLAIPLPPTGNPKGPRLSATTSNVG